MPRASREALTKNRKVIKEMNNAFSRIGRTCASVLAGGVLMAGAMLAAGPVNPVTVTLAQPVTVGSTTLPAGQYVITSFEMGGDDLFVVRGDKTAPVTLIGVPSDDPSDKTQVVLSKDGDKLHFSKLTVAGTGAFEFITGK
jgi:hypothetical protein